MTGPASIHPVLIPSNVFASAPGVKNSDTLSKKWTGIGVTRNNASRGANAAAAQNRVFCQYLFITKKE